MFKQTKHTNDKGFTIVELLVVIVVIGILAAITIVSYTGVTTRAKAAQAQANAVSVQSVAEAMNADNGYYPKRITGLNSFGTGSTTTKIPAGITIIAGAPDATNGQTTIGWSYCGTAAAPAADTEIGGRITYWDYNTGAVKYIAVGSGLAQLANPATATCNTWVGAN